MTAIVLRTASRTVDLTGRSFSLPFLSLALGLCPVVPICDSISERLILRSLRFLPLASGAIIFSVLVNCSFCAGFSTTAFSSATFLASSAARRLAASAFLRTFSSASAFSRAALSAAAFLIFSLRSSSSIFRCSSSVRIFICL